MKKFLTLTWLLVFTVFSVAQEKNKDIPDLNGIWILDNSKSKFDGKKNPHEITMVIVQNEPEISFTQSIKSENGKTSVVKSIYFTDGRKISANGILDRYNYGIVKWEGKKLVKVDTYVLNYDASMSITEKFLENNQMKTKTVWELSKDSKTLTGKIIHEYSNSVPIPSSEIKYVYQRKP